MPIQGNVVLVLQLLQGSPTTGGPLNCSAGRYMYCIDHDGTALGEGYCSARGEILRPLQDQLQRRRFASACLSIKNESVGSEDDQTPS